MPMPKMAKEREELIVQMIRDGYSYADISVTTGACPNVISRVKKKYGVVPLVTRPPKKHGQMDDAHVVLMRKDYPEFAIEWEKARKKINERVMWVKEPGPGVRKIKMKKEK